MNGLSYLIACLKECKQGKTTISNGGYNTTFKEYTVINGESVTVYTMDNKTITLYSNNHYLWSDYDENFDILEIHY